MFGNVADTNIHIIVIMLYHLYQKFNKY